MQTIGKMEDGRMLVVLGDTEVKLLAAIEGVIFPYNAECKLVPIPHEPPQRIPLPAPEAPRPGRSRARKGVGRRKIHAVTGAATETPAAGVLICRNCKNPFKRKKGSRSLDCSAKCLKEFKRNYARENWRKNHGKKKSYSGVDARRSPQSSGEDTTMPPNPASPFLTPEQREKIQADRLKLIAASAQRHKDD